jgi:hypothetical protein
MKLQTLAVEKFTAVFLAVSTLGIAACDRDEESSRAAIVQQRISDNLPGVVQGLSDSMAVAIDMLPQLPLLEDVPVEAGEIPWEDVIEFLTDEVLIEENYDGNGYFRLWGDDLCGFIEENDPACAQTVDLAELRIRALELPDNGALLALAIGPDKAEPVILETFPSSLTLTGDLDATKGALEHLHNAVDASIPVPAIFEGKTVLNIDLNGKASAAMAVSIPKAIAILLTSDEGDVFAFTTEARTPLWSFAAKPGTFSALVDVGITQMVAGPYEFVWQGTTGSVEVHEGDTQITFENLSLGKGESYAAYEGHTLWAIELNAESDHQLSMSVLPASDGFPIFVADPEFDLSVAVDFVGDDVPDFLIDQTYRVRLAGDVPAVQPGDEHLAVVSGELSISSTAVAEPVIVSAGQCLVEDEVTAGEHSILGALTVIPCP